MRCQWPGEGPPPGVVRSCVIAEPLVALVEALRPRLVLCGVLRDLYLREIDSVRLPGARRYRACIHATATLRRRKVGHSSSGREPTPYGESTDCSAAVQPASQATEIGRLAQCA
jgi:hypothetical protein